MHPIVRAAQPGERTPRSYRLRYKSIESILRQGLERKAFPEQQDLELGIAHENIRGSDYYH